MKTNNLAIALAVAALTAIIATGCGDKSKDNKDTGGFVDKPKPVNNDGMVRKPEPPPTAAPDFSKAVTVEPRFDAATNTITAVLHVGAGFHAYAPGETIGKPVELLVANTNGWALDGAVNIPAGVTKEVAGEKSVILEGDVSLTAKVKGGKGDIAGEVKVQVCTDGACDKPRSYPFTLAAK